MPSCGVCGREFSTEVALGQHMRDKHSTEQSSPPAVPVQNAASKSRSKQKSLRRRNRHPVAIGILGGAAALGVGLFILFGSAFNNPFPFPCLAQEGNFLHIHPQLTIEIEGSNITIPADVGITSTCLQPMHTHDTSGIIHIEAPAYVNYTLGDFFDIWKARFGTFSFNGTNHPVVFNSTDILGYKTDSTHTLALLVDGSPSTAWTSLNLDRLDNLPNPRWNNGNTPYPYGTGHTIVIRYVSS